MGVTVCLARLPALGVCAGEKITDAVKGMGGGEKRNRVLAGSRLLNYSKILVSPDSHVFRQTEKAW